MYTWFIFWTWDDDDGLPHSRTDGPLSDDDLMWGVHMLQMEPQAVNVLIFDAATQETWICKKNGQPRDIQLVERAG